MDSICLLGCKGSFLSLEEEDGIPVELGTTYLFIEFKFIII